MSSHSLNVSPSFVDCCTSTDSLCLSGTSNAPGCSNSVGDDDEDSTGQTVCAWCQKIGSKMFSLKTINGFKAFCSELCFAQCRRASFKKNKVCDWCKHVRHTVNYVDFHNGQQSLQFCSDKCLNQYKMNIFCRETQAHLNAFSAFYRSPSPPSSYFSRNNFNRSKETSENDKDDSKETEISPLTTPDFWPRNPGFQQLTPSSSTSPQTPSSLSSSSHRSSSPLLSPTLESLCSSSLANLPQQSNFPSQLKDKCSEAVDLKPTFTTDQSQPKETPQTPKILTKKLSVKTKLVSCANNNKSQPGIGLKTVKKQRKIQRKLANNQENVSSRKQIIPNIGESSKDNSVSSCSTSSNHSSPFSALNQPSNQQVEDKHSGSAVNCPSPFPNLPHPMMKIPHPPHQFLPPFRADFSHLRQPQPMPFPFNPNLFRLPGHHRPPFPVHHLPFSCHPHLHDNHRSQTSPPIQFQQSLMEQSQLNNSFNHQPCSPNFLVSNHPFLLPFPMPIPMSFPFPIKLNSSCNLKSLISTEEQVQVGFTDKMFSQFTCCNSGQIDDVDPPMTIVNVSEHENETKFRIDTLMNKLIDERMRAMSQSPDQELVNIHSKSDFKRTKIEKSPESGPNFNDESRISSNDYHSSCLIKAKRFKRDILTI